MGLINWFGLPIFFFCLYFIRSTTASLHQKLPLFLFYFFDTVSFHLVEVNAAQGHDVVAIACPERFVVGLDISENAIKQATKVRANTFDHFNLVC